jgi:hypothetical protein
VLCSRAVLAVAALLSSASSSPSPAAYVRVRSPDLYGRVVVVDGQRYGATRLLAGADPERDGLWVQLPPGRTATVSVEPALSRAAHVEHVAVPDGLRSGWSVVPLPLGGWGAASLDEVASFAVSKGRRGPHAGSVALRRTETSAVGCAPRPSFAPPALPARVADFEGGPLEPLGNRFGFFSGRGGTSSGRRVRDEHGTRLVVSVDAPAGSFGGLWLELGPPAALADPSAGIDYGALDAIVIRGRGAPKGAVRLSDVDAAARDKGVAVGTLGGAAERDGTWTRRLELGEIRVDRRRLRALSIDLTPGGGRLEIDEIVFVGRGQSVPPPHHPPGSRASGRVERGLWVWHTRELLEDDAEVRRLLKQARSWSLSELYLQIPHADDDGLADWATSARVSALAALVTRLHAAGLRVHALDGAPWLALPEARPDLLALAASVATYNAGRPPSGRFDALHLDIEPYLLPGFSGPGRSELLASLANTLPLVKEAARLPLWIDVPFWFDSADSRTTVERGPEAGCAKPRFLDAALRVVDGLGVMAYRTRADGADGIAAVALGELTLARRSGKDMRVGVETIRLRDEEAWHVDLEAASRPVGGRPAVAIPAPDAGYVLFTTAYDPRDGDTLLRARPGLRVLAANHEKGAASTKISFHGRPRAEMEQVVGEALELLGRAGHRAPGIAYHEARTLP